ncbi:hypothetical protein BJ912DRAFT_1025204 [Pholiota molesta]|nr:hypothetical protein BJ912DRAFT_1025204 [Pholiota molesta]
MYSFCRGRGLREVWGYMWSSWYSPKMWALWARSTSPYVSRLRTTMGVENYWRQLKHNYLHNTPRPRLDHLIWILIYKVTPTFMARGNILQDTFRLGRSKQLSTFQRYFKKNWEKHAEKELGTTKYITNVSAWTCTCGRQKYDCHHLCKHLVQSVPPPPTKFWGEIRRRRVRPLYQHPALQARNPGPENEQSNELEMAGTITDGDDYEISPGNKSILRGGGGWRELELHGNVASGKRKRLEDPESKIEDTIDLVTPTAKRARSTDPSTSTILSPPEIIDITSSSPGSIQMLLREDFESSNRVCIEDSDDDDEVSAENDPLIPCAIHFVEDINRHVKTGRKRDTTWAIGKDKIAKRRVRNTMGYMAPTDDEHDDK